MHTFIFNNNSSLLDAYIYPPIVLDENSEHVLGLTNFETYNAVPNIDEENNQINIGGIIFAIPVGSYDIHDINILINEKIVEYKRQHATFDCIFDLSANLNTLKCKIRSTCYVDFSAKNTFAKVLGFENIFLQGGVDHVSKHPVNIMKVNAIKVECNITTGSYNNGQLGHTIHEFFPTAPSGFKIIESPQNVIYLPINTSVISYIQVKIVDQDDVLINFRGETITVRLHLKKKNYGY